MHYAETLIGRFDMSLELNKFHCGILGIMMVNNIFLRIITFVYEMLIYFSMKLWYNDELSLW